MKKMTYSDGKDIFPRLFLTQMKYSDEEKSPKMFLWTMSPLASMASRSRPWCSWLAPTFPMAAVRRCGIGRTEDLVMTNSWPWNMAIEIVDFPGFFGLNMVIFDGYVELPTENHYFQWKTQL